jgi:hypothetical protein
MGMSWLELAPPTIFQMCKISFLVGGVDFTRNEIWLKFVFLVSPAAKCVFTLPGHFVDRQRTERRAVSLEHGCSMGEWPRTLYIGPGMLLPGFNDIERDPSLSVHSLKAAFVCLFSVNFGGFGLNG